MALTMVGSAEVLETFSAPPATGRQVYTFESDELTAHCPFEFGGPDYYDVTLRYVPAEECLESRSLKRYLESLRDTEITAERLGCEFYDALATLLEPESLYVRLEQARRGGVEQVVEVGDDALARTA
jgi:7-cyano-7-deazaguanine reductase